MLLARLPARVPIEDGESLASFATRLAEVNDLSVSEIAGTQIESRSDYARSKSRAVDRVSALSGVSRSRLKESTLDDCAVGLTVESSRWRLRTTIWDCMRCASRGIKNRERGLAIQFACPRCLTLLTSVTGRTRPTAAAIELDPITIAIQREMLQVFHQTAAKSTAAMRIDRLSIVGVVLGDMLAKHNQVEGRVVGDGNADRDGPGRTRRERWCRGALRLPEDPIIFAEVFRAGWDASASDYVHELRIIGGDVIPRRLQDGLDDSSASVEISLTSSNRRPDGALDIGPRLRELRDRHGLEAVHVPNMIRYADDPMLISAAEWSWRRRLCNVLYDWLSNLECDVPERPEGSRRWFDVLGPHGYTSEHFGERHPMHALRVADDLISLAETLVRRGLHRCPDERTGISNAALRSIAPGVATFARATDFAEQWIWLDATVGTDAHTRLPHVHAKAGEIQRFHRRLGPEGRLWLREYGLAGANEFAEPAISKSPQGDPACSRTA